jgi:hypothetical protein
MHFLIGNPWGWLGLLGLPVVAALFMLQQKSRVLRTSTLFLLEHLVPESRGGRRLQRLVQSVPLWLMLAAVALLTWLLLDPRRVDQRSRQLVVLVMDSSYSMQASEAWREEAMRGPLERLAATAGHSSWIVTESDLSRPLLYRGEDLGALWPALRGWKAQAGSHDVEPAVQAARALAGADGLVIFVTDHKPRLPEGVGWIAVGRPLDNAGFAGGVVRLEEGGKAGWEAVVRNYAGHPAKVSWKWADGAGASPPQELELKAGEGALLKGSFPPGRRETTLELEGDGFALDDRLPLLVPEEKVLRVSLVRPPDLGPETAAFLQAMRRSLPGFREAREGTSPDLVVLAGQTRDLAGYGKNAVVLYKGGNGPRSAALPVMERHELVRDLSWNGLLAEPMEEAALGPGDEALLWKGDKPLIVLRTLETAAGPVSQLHFFFDFEQSNAARLPATAVLLYRFCSLIRSAAVGYASGNVVLGQALDVAGLPGRPPVLEGTAEGEGRGTRRLEAPRSPGFFQAVQNGEVLFRGAAQFADVQEADFSLAETGDGTAFLALKQGRANSEKDLLAPLWVLALGSCLLLAWWWEAPAFVLETGAAPRKET